jgi:phage gp46-like protein
MDAYIDPTTAAYVRTATDLQRDPADGLANAIYLRLMTPLGSWWAQPTIGSRLHELVRAKASTALLQAARQSCQQALAPMVTDGRLSGVEIDAELHDMADGSKSMALRVVATAANGRVVTFTHHVPVA